MKNVIIIGLLVLFGLSACSSSDDSSDNQGFYLEVNLDGETYKKSEVIGFASFSVDDCFSDNYYTFQSIGQFEDSNIFLDVFLIHHEAFSEFQSYDLNDGSVIANSVLQDDDCYDNFDLIMNLSINNGEYLGFDNAENNFSRIISVTMLSEDSTEITYSVHGEFDVSFIKADNSTTNAKGSYTTPIYILK